MSYFIHMLSLYAISLVEIWVEFLLSDIMNNAAMKLAYVFM